ncbi:MAG: hypothetical protein AAF433_11160 [Bacteroidota bacterium]
MQRYVIAIKAVADLFKHVGQPTQSSLQSLKTHQQQVEALPPSNSFCITFDLLPRTEVSCQWNTKAMLGLDKVDVATYFDLIHPRWWMTYLFFSRAVYELGTIPDNGITDHAYAYQMKLPLRTANGEYTWFNQITFPGALDERERMCSHLNIYQLDRRFEEVSILSSPLLTDGSRPVPFLVDHIQSRTEKLFLNTYLSPLKPRAQQVLYLYRKLVIDHLDDEVSSQMIAEASNEIMPGKGISKATVEKRNRDILACARRSSVIDHSPLVHFREVKKIARFLNAAFGPPTSAEIVGL